MRVSLQIHFIYTSLDSVIKKNKLVLEKKITSYHKKLDILKLSFSDNNIGSNYTQFHANYTLKIFTKFYNYNLISAPLKTREK